MQELDSKPDECISFYVAARCESLVVPIIRDGTVQVRPSRLVSGFTSIRHFSRYTERHPRDRVSFCI
nr:MAG TPA: hypothetical protein [Caudoviricetes sp.]